MKWISVFLMLLVVSACGHTTELKPAPAVNTVKAGQSLLIILEETHKDGSTWQLSGDYNRKVISYEKEAWHGPTKGIYFHLRAVQSGSTELHFIKRKYTDTLDKVTYIISNHQ